MNYLTGRGPSVTCEYCGSIFIFHVEATGCPNPRCAAHAGAQEFERWKNSNFALVYNNISAARAVRNSKHQDKVIARVGFKWVLVDPVFAKRMKLRTVKQ